ncbi:MAG: amidohydrolase family protein [Verrucomicrobiota bacterium]
MDTVTNHSLSRRQFLASSALLLVGASGKAAESASAGPEPIIDIHQHTYYSGRTNQQLLAHQRAMGITITVLLPAGRMYGLEARCGGNESVVEFVGRHPNEFVYFANEIPDIPEARSELERYLRAGAKGIGEQKFKLECDSAPIELIAEIAQSYGVPVLMHFQHGTYNTSFQRFHKILEKYPKVNFIGHAQTWWGNIDANLNPTLLYPTGPVTPGGLTDRWLADYPNMFGDLSAGSGLNALLRDEDFTRGFLDRHQGKLLYGSDCNDTIGRGPGCQGAQTLKTLRRLVPDKTAERKILFENAKRVLKLDV